MKTFRIFILLFAILFCQCSSSEIGKYNYEQLDNTAGSAGSAVRGMGYQEEAAATLIFRGAIFLKRVKTSPPMPSPPLNFFIYDIKNEKIIYQSSLANGRVSWKNNEQVEIETIPGTVTGFEPPDAFKNIYDVRQQKILEKK